MDNQERFIKEAIEEILQREMEGLSTIEQVAVTMCTIQLMGCMHGLPLRLKIKIIDILSDYLHRSDGLLKE